MVEEPRIDHIARQKEALSDYLMDLTKDGIESGRAVHRFLVLANAGGIVATISFLGASMAAGNKPAPVLWSLTAFVVGFFGAGLVVISGALYTERIWDHVRRHADLFDRGVVNYSEAVRAEEDGTLETVLWLVSGLFAILGFLTGAGIGIYYLYAG